MSDSSRRGPDGIALPADPPPAGRAGSAALSFGPVAQEYDRLRPRYPRAAVRWAAGDPPPAVVVDLGAGTGILTRALVELGYQVIAVEPDPLMRARLAAATPGVTPVGGSAERLPLADASAGAALAAQAYHWFDRDRAHAQIARVLRRNGVFGVIWNIRDESVPWVRELSEIMVEHVHDHRTDRVDEGPGPLDERFGPVERAEFRHRSALAPESIAALMRTRSSYLTAPAPRRAAADRALRELLGSHPALRGRQVIELPYRTIAYRTRRA